MRGFADWHPAVQGAYFLLLLGVPLFSLHPLLVAAELAATGLSTGLVCGWKKLGVTLLAFLPVVLFCVGINPLFVYEGNTQLFWFYGNPVSLEAVMYGSCLAGMLLTMACGFRLLDKLFPAERLAHVLGRLFPVLALLLSMMLRFVPLFCRRFAEVSRAQRGIGMDKDAGGLKRRASALTRELSILISWSLEDALATSDAMRARGYGLRGRTSYAVYRFGWRDGAHLAAVLALAGSVLAAILCGCLSVWFYPTLAAAPPSPLSLSVGLVWMLFCLLPALCRRRTLDQAVQKAH